MSTTQPEARLVAQIRRWLEAQGCWSIKHHGGPWSVAGVPDILACVRGSFVALEVKLPGRKPTELQALVCGRIAAAGGVVAVVHSLAEVRAIVEPMLGSPLTARQEPATLPR